MAEKVDLDFYGVRVSVSSESSALLEEVRRDFIFFSTTDTSAAPALEVTLEIAEPPYAGLPDITSTVLTPRNISFKDRDRTYIDYFGNGLAILDETRTSCTIFSPEIDLAHEIAYLFILSTVGQRLDRRGLHRLHALAMSYEGRTALIVLPSGGGKSTLALNLLGRPGYKLVAEDTPLIDRAGNVHPFPLRVGLRAGSKHEVPAEFVRTMKRMEFDPKTLIDISYFGDRVGGESTPELLLVGTRSLGAVSRLEPISKLEAFGALLRYMIVGLGVYQGLEFLLERGVGDLLKQTKNVASRILASLRLLKRVRCYRFVMGRDGGLNVETIGRLLEGGQSAGGRSDVGTPQSPADERCHNIQS